MNTRVLKKISRPVFNLFIENAQNLFPELKFKYKNEELSLISKKKLNSNDIDSINNAINIFKRIEEKKIIYKKKNSINFSNNPLDELKKKKEVNKISDGLFQFQGEFLKLFRLLQVYFKSLALKKFDAIDQENPVLWPLDLIRKINFFEDFPHQLLMVSGVKKNSKNFEKFIKNFSKKKNTQKVEISKDFYYSSYGLQSAVCDNCYYSLQNNKNFKNSIYTTSNKVFRNEISDHKSLDRLVSFTVTDIMFVGDKQFVLKIRNKLLKELIKFFNKTGLNFSIEVGDDPFFLGKLNKKIFQQAHELKYEILTYIPFLKKRIAVGSINLHLDTFSRAFNIKNNKKFIHSGCVGIGFERLMLALYSQHGNKVTKWPKKLLNEIKYKNER